MLYAFRCCSKAPAASANAIADHINWLFHCPKKSPDERIGKKKASGMTYAIAVKILSLSIFVSFQITPEQIMNGYEANISNMENTIDEVSLINQTPYQEIVLGVRAILPLVIVPSSFSSSIA